MQSLESGKVIASRFRGRGVLPEAVCQVNQQGLDYYDQLVDQLLAADIDDGDR